MQPALEKLAEIFRELSRGRHLSSVDGETYAALDKNPLEYKELFAQLGFELVHDARGFYYFHGSNKGIAGGIHKIALFVYIFIDWAADRGDGITDAILAQSHELSAMPHFNSERYKGYMRQVEVTTEDQLADILRSMDNFGFVRQLNDGRFRFLPPVYRILDACEVAKPVLEDDSVEEE